MNTNSANKVFYIIFILIFLMGMMGTPVVNVKAQEPDPFFIVRLNENLIEAFNWPTGIPITLTIDDPATPQPDYSQTKAIPLEYSNQFRFKLDNFIMEPGFIVTMTDGAIIRTHTVFNLTVAGVDIETDTVFGTAEPGTFVHVSACNESGCGNPGAVRHVFPDENGSWVADFAHPGFGGDEQSLFDIREGKRGEAFQFEYPDVNSTSWSWRVPNPGISVTPDGIWGTEWLMGTNITLTVDDPSNETDIDYTETKPVEWPAWANKTTTVFYLPEDLQIQPGFELAMTDGTINKTYTVIYLKIMNIDVNNDTVSGVADAGKDVWVWMEGGDRTVTAASDGAWIADLGVPGSRPGEESTFDILPDTFVMAMVNDGNNNGTTDWETAMRPPQFMLSGSGSDWGIDAWNWPLDSQVTLSVDDPNTSQNPDYTEVQTMHQGNDSYHATHAEYGFEGGPGFIITLSDGIKTKTMIVPLLAVTGYDLANDTISGLSDPFTRVTVPVSNADGSEYAERTVVTDSGGNWLANFAVSNNPDEVIFDLQPGDAAEPQIYDTDRDHIVLRDWSVPIDIDRDGVTDVLDPCPDDATDTCNVAGSAAGAIGVDGGMLATGNGKVTLSVPLESLAYDVTLSITDMGSGYELETDEGLMMVVHSYSIQPNGTQFDPPASITFRWDDADNNGIVDGTTVQESYLRLIKDGLVITPDCSANPNCNIAANELTVQVSDLSLFALAAPIEWTLKGFYQPVDMNGVYNIVKNGSTVPLKFEIFAGSTELTDVIDIKSLTYAQTSCDANATTDEIETTATGGTSLRYADGQFIYNWKTPKSAGMCYRVTMTAIDGSTLMAYFKLK